MAEGSKESAVPAERAPVWEGAVPHLTCCLRSSSATHCASGNRRPLYEILAAREVRVHLVTARQLKHVPGRKSAVQDCQWLQCVPTCGLLRGSCRPEAEMGAVRASWRHWAAWLEYRAAQIQHRPKALPQMNVQFTQVLTDIPGASWTGPYQPAQVFALKQALALSDVYTAQGREGDAEIARRFQAITPVWPAALPLLNRAHQHRTHHKKAPDDDARGLL